MTRKKTDLLSTSPEFTFSDFLTQCKPVITHSRMAGYQERSANLQLPCEQCWIHMKRICNTLAGSTHVLLLWLSATGNLQHREFATHRRAGGILTLAPCNGEGVRRSMIIGNHSPLTKEQGLAARPFGSNLKFQWEWMILRLIQTLKEKLKMCMCGL